MTRLQCQLGHPILLSIYKKMLSACNMNRFFLFPSPDRTGKTIHGGSLGPEELHWLGSARSSSVTAPRTRGLVVEGNFFFSVSCKGDTSSVCSGRSLLGRRETKSRPLRCTTTQTSTRSLSLYQGKMSNCFVFLILLASVAPILPAGETHN